MEIQEILEYNKRCAEFLGWKKPYEEDELLMYVIPKNFAWTEFFNLSDEFEALLPEQLLFHSDWNWIMEVVERIKQLGYFVMINKWTSVYTSKEGDRIQITTVEGENTKVNTVQAINQFLNKL